MTTVNTGRPMFFSAPRHPVAKHQARVSTTSRIQEMAAIAVQKGKLLEKIVPRSVELAMQIQIAALALHKLALLPALKELRFPSGKISVSPYNAANFAVSLMVDQKAADISKAALPEMITVATEPSSRGGDRVSIKKFTIDLDRVDETLEACKGYIDNARNVYERTQAETLVSTATVEELERLVAELDILCDVVPMIPTISFKAITALGDMSEGVTRNYRDSGYKDFEPGKDT